VKLLSRLPLRLLYAVSSLGYVGVYYGLRYRRRLVRENLERAFPDATDREIVGLERAFYRNLVDVVVEIFKAQTMRPDEFRARVRLENGEILEPFFRRHQAVMFLATHQCNWEWLLLAMGAHLERPIDPIYKPLHQRGIDRRMLGLRARFGSRPIPVTDAFMEIMRRRKTAAGFAMVADQAPPRGEEQYWTRFLHQDTAFYVGSEKIARLGRFPVVFVAMERLGRGRYRARLELLASPPYEGAGHTIIERYARRAEQQIRAHPGDWLWSHRRWKYPRPLYG
jgi:KDO2-lipid IV(A) lauroyltransferase